MICHIDLVKNVDDLAVAIDQERGSVDAHVFLAVHAFFRPDTILLDHVLFGVGNELVRQVELGDKLLVRLLAIGRNSENHNVLVVKFVARITERTRFLGSARCVVFGIKPKHDTFAAVIRELDRITILIAGLEFRCLVANFYHIFAKTPVNSTFWIVA